MFVTFEVATVMVVAVAMALALAHALEWPGKKRLSREQYLATQPIYYPGFTFAGIAEPVGVLMTAVLAATMPFGSPVFWLTAGASLSLALMHAAYWLLTHPVNNFWLKGFELKGVGKSFFAAGSAGMSGGKQEPNWTVLRNRWENSHMVRAGFGVLGLLLLVCAVAIGARPETP